MTAQRDTTTGISMRVTHSSEYQYSEAVSTSYHQALLTPRTTPSQRNVETRITIDPPAEYSESRSDYFGNLVTQFTVSSSHRRLHVEADSTIVMTARPPAPLPRTAPLADLLGLVRHAENDDDLAAFEFAFDSPQVLRSPELADYARKSFDRGQPFLNGVEAFMKRIHSEFTYDTAVTTVSTPVAEVLQVRKGVCQDFAHLMIGGLRSLGAPARYISGYLVPGAGVVGAQASHAWVSVYCPGNGWFDFDPTNDVRPSSGHITLAWGRDFSDVSPLRGVMIGGGEHVVNVEVHVARAG
jgi:transglutaminase-like putative cysteine protease